MEIRLKDHLCFRLYVASRLIIQAYGEEFQPLGLTYLKYLVLLALLEKDEQTVNELGGLLSLDSGTLSPLLKSLAKQGFVQRTRLESDERTVVNTITSSGRTVCTRAKKIAVTLYKETQIEEEKFFALRADMDDYVGRCKRILETKKSGPKRPTKKESSWKTRSKQSSGPSSLTPSH